MSTLLSVDPGIRGSGAAIFIDAQLIRAGYVQNPEREGGGPQECVTMAHAIALWVMCEHRPTELAVEIPQIYGRGGGKTKGDPNYLLPLFGVQCAIAMLLRTHAKVTAYKPADWKGSTSKPLRQDGKVEYVITRRVKERLSADELKCVDWTQSVKHSWDVADAVALGLHHLGRFDRVRKFARE